MNIVGELCGQQPSRKGSTWAAYIWLARCNGHPGKMETAGRAKRPGTEYKGEWTTRHQCKQKRLCTNLKSAASGWLVCVHKPQAIHEDQVLMNLRTQGMKAGICARPCAWPLQGVWVDLLRCCACAASSLTKRQPQCTALCMASAGGVGGPADTARMRMWGVDGTHYFAIVSCRVSHMSHVSHVCTCSCEVAHVHACMHASHAINAHVSCWPLMP
eukprot:scaffold51060_cov26-Tisochrysis_lutea.AAC.2